uniref:Endoplasmic reticulum lectin 1 n=1 Tax=Homo sapiens TaxID=9606 RepID=A0A8I5KV23_HUMAN
MEEGGGGVRSLVPGGPVLLVLCGLLEASGGGRALPQLSDDIPFRVNWPGTEFSLRQGLTMLPRLVSNSWAQAILVPEPPRILGLHV